jgi:hypothetical protein
MISKYPGQEPGTYQRQDALQPKQPPWCYEVGSAYIVQENHRCCPENKLKLTNALFDGTAEFYKIKAGRRQSLKQYICCHIIAYCFFKHHTQPRVTTHEQPFCQRDAFILTPCVEWALLQYFNGWP